MQYVIKHIVWYLLSSVCFVVNVKIPGGDQLQNKSSDLISRYILFPENVEPELRFSPKEFSDHVVGTTTHNCAGC